MPASPPPTAVLLLTCPDQKGLMAAMADFVFEHKGNIIDVHQFTAQDENLFLLRIEWELEGFDLPRAQIADRLAPIGARFRMNWELRFSDQTPRVAIFVSRFGHCLHDLLMRRREGEFRAEFPLVISNHETLRREAERFGVPFHHLPIAPGAPQAKAEQEAAILALLKRERIDLLVLARYMQVLSPEFVAQFPRRILNIHHSFLPAFAGGKPYHQAHEHGVKIVGATAHYVTADLDAGPIIEQDVTRVTYRDGVNDLVRKGRDLEKVVLSRALRLHLENKVLVYNHKTAVFE